MSEALSIGLQMTAVGITIVFSSLIVVSLALTAMNTGFAALERRTAESERRAAEAERDAAPETAGGLRPQTLAVIVAAASLAIGRPIRVERVRYREGAPAAHWSRQGRATIMGSHRVRR